MQSLRLPALIVLCLAAGCARSDRAPEAVSVPSPPAAITASPSRPPDTAAAPSVDSVSLAEGELADSIDFVVDGFTLGMDSSAVRAALGAPDSVHTVDNPLDVGAKLHMWYYPSVKVDFLFDGQLTGVFLLDASRSTQRGLRVGDPEARVYELYGPRTAGSDGTLQYMWAPQYQRILQVRLVGGRVSEIFVGFALD